jgi:hypothetical protein
MATSPEWTPSVALRRQTRLVNEVNPHAVEIFDIAMCGLSRRFATRVATGVVRSRSRRHDRNAPVTITGIVDGDPERASEYRATDLRSTAGSEPRE